MRSVWPSVSGWYAVLRFDWIPSKAQSEAQKRETKCLPRSETMSEGVPCFEKTWSKKVRARRGVSSSERMGMKSAIFVSRSTTTKIMSWPLEMGSHSMKSMDMEDHGLSGIGRKRSGPYGLCRTVFALLQVVQART